MNEFDPKKASDITVRAGIEKGYQPTVPENVFKVDQSPITVKPEEIVDILIDCTKGFSVFIPYPGFFGDYVFEATEQPIWAPDPSTAKEKWWGARLKRTKPENQNSNKELSYCIYSKDLDNFAVGNSPPTMILDP
jgi:hypothetical protein